MRVLYYSMGEEYVSFNLPPYVGQSLRLYGSAKTVCNLGNLILFRIFNYSIRFSLGFWVMPGILPLLAMGLPSISWRSAVQSIGLAPLM